MTTASIQPPLLSQTPVSALTPTPQGRFSLNCNAFIKLVTVVTSIAVAVIAFIGEQYLIAALTASLAIFAMYSCVRGEPTSAPRIPTPPTTPRQNPNPNPQGGSGTPPTPQVLPGNPNPNPQGGSGTPSTPPVLPGTPNSGQPPILPLLPNDSSSTSGSRSTTPTSSASSTPRSGSEELEDLDADDASLGETGGSTSPRTPIGRIIATRQTEIFETPIDSSNNSSNSSSAIPSRSSSARNLAALDLAVGTFTSPVRTGGWEYAPRKIRKEPLSPSLTALPDSSSDEEGSVVEDKDLVQGSDPRASSTANHHLSSAPKILPTQTAGGDSVNGTVGTLIEIPDSVSTSTAGSLAPVFNAEAENVTHTYTTEPSSTFTENLIDLAFIEDEGT